ncbi:uncharacterized protein [Centruroides vittatus]|uniref:uncharacterized protein n=1 Tax=Centruroides vittatus TaxID=120091 RepID=UPI0035101CDF
MQNAKLQIEYNLKSPNYTLQGYLFVNDEKKLNMSGGFSGRNLHNFECNIVIESYLTSAFVGHIKGKINNLLKKIDVVFRNNSMEKFSARFFTDSGRPDHNGELEVKGEGKRIIYMDVKCEETFAKKRCYLNFGGAITSFVLLNFTRENFIIKPAINICWKGKYKNFDCVEIDISLKHEYSPHTTDVARGIKINIKTPGKEEWSLEFLKSMKKEDYQHKFILASPEIKIGYDVHIADIGLPTKTGQIQIYFPSRVIKAQGRLRAEFFDFDISSELSLDAKRQPDRKYSFDYYYKYKYVGITYHIDSKLELNSPALSKPISAEFNALAKTEDDVFSTYTTFTLDYSNNRRKNIYADIRTNISPDLVGNNTISFLLRSEDYRLLNIWMNSHLAYTRELISSGFQWEFTSNYGRKKSGLSFIKIELLNNTFEILHKCDKDTFDAFGKWKFLSNDILITDLDVRINNERRKRIEATTEYRKPCITIIYHLVGNKTKETKYHFCINFDKQNLLLLTANAFYDNKKITDFLITFNSKINKFLITTSDETSLQSLETAVITIISDSVTNFVNYTSLMGIIAKEYILEKLSDFNPTFNTGVWPEILEFEEELENNVRLASRKVRAIYQTLPSKRDIRDSLKPLTDYVEKMKEGLGEFYDKVRPKFLDKYIDKSKKAIEETTNSVFNYFHSLKEVVRNHGIKAIVSKLYYDILSSLSSLSKEKKVE